MSLRDQLKRAVASCAPIETQRATFGDASATGNATPAQPPCNSPMRTAHKCATGRATGAQQGPETRATLGAQQTPPSCAHVASELTAQRLLKRLLAAAMKACDAHGDGEQAREQMRLDVLNTPPEQRASLLEHFQETYGDTPNPEA